MKTKVKAVLAVLLVVSGALSAQNITQIERYVSVDNKPSAAQLNPLLTVAQVHFPKDIQTVGEAVQYWISYSGYRLIDEKKLSGEARDVLKQKLPQADRTLGPLSVKDGLQVLMGQDVFDLVCDPLHRMVSFELKKKYKLALYQSKGGKA